MYNKNTAIEVMNNYGKDKIPFLFIIDFEMNNIEVFEFNKIHPDNILFDINGFNNYDSIPVRINHNNPVFLKTPVSFETYSTQFENVLKNIRYGNSYLLNLTAPTEIQTDISLKEIFFRSKAKYKLWFQNKFVVFSPEIFVKIENNTISSYPMKGTIDASISDAENIILSDFKETAEHYTIVDLIRNDLSCVAKKVRVEKFRYIDKIKTNQKILFQVSSIIKGFLPDNYSEKIGDILFTLLPAGSVTGAPKKKTVEIILETEQYNRGYYTGIFGYFDGIKLDSGVMIRYIENTENKLVFKSGGGITIFSDVMSEYNEMVDKVYLPI